MHSDLSTGIPPHLVRICPTPLHHAFNAAESLEVTRTLRDSGWRVSLLGMGPVGKHLIRDVEVICLSRSDVYFLRQVLFHLRCIRFLVREFDTTDIVLFGQLSAPWLLPIWLLRRLRSKRAPLLVMDTRTVPMEMKSASSWKDTLRGEFCNLMNQTAHHWTDGQTAITERMARLVNIPSEQLWGTWPSGVKLEEFAWVPERRHWPSDGDPINVTYIGMLHYERNLMSLCQAIEEANAEGMSFTLTLIGDGTQRSELEKFAFQTEDRIRVVPPVAHQEIPALLVNAHVGALPFPNEEKFQVSSPIKLFEYMGAGLPILATRITCHTDVIDGGKYVFWAEDATKEGLLSAVRSIWHNRGKLDRMGRGAAAAARKWTWKESALKLKRALIHGMQKGYETREVT